MSDGANFAVVIDAGMAVPQEVWLNGHKLPAVRSTMVSYQPNDVREVTVTFIASSLIELHPTNLEAWKAELVNPPVGSGA